MAAAAAAVVVVHNIFRLWIAFAEAKTHGISSRAWRFIGIDYTIPTSDVGREGLVEGTRGVVAGGEQSLSTPTKARRVERIDVLGMQERVQEILEEVGQLPEQAGVFGRRLVEPTQERMRSDVLRQRNFSLDVRLRYFQIFDWRDLVDRAVRPPPEARLDGLRVARQRRAVDRPRVHHRVVLLGEAQCERARFETDDRDDGRVGEQVLPLPFCHERRPCGR